MPAPARQRPRPPLHALIRLVLALALTLVASTSALASPSGSMTAARFKAVLQDLASESGSRQAAAERVLLGAGADAWGWIRGAAREALPGTRRRLTEILTRSRLASVRAACARAGRAVRWTHVLGGRPARAPLIAGDRVLLLRTDGTLVALDRSDGTPRWRHTVDASGGLAARGDGVRARVRGRLTTLDLATGRPSPPGAALTGRLAGAGRRLLVHTADTLSALTWAGRPAWTATRGCATPPLPVDQTLICAGIDGRLTAYALVDGRPLWRSLRLPTAAALGRRGDTLLVAADRHLYGLSIRRGGKASWRVALSPERARPAPEAAPATGLVVAGPLAVVAHAGAIVTVDLQTRAVRWRYPSAAPSVTRWAEAGCGAPAVAGGRVWFGDEAGLLAVDPATGRVRCRLPLALGVHHAPVPAGEGLIAVEGRPAGPAGDDPGVTPAIVIAMGAEDGR